MTATIRVTGDDELRRKLRALTDTARGEATQRALKAGASLVLNDAKRRAPFLTGTLRRSLHIEEVSDSAVAVGTDVEYAARQEFGFNGTDSLGRTYSQAANPYLRPALFENEDVVVEEVAAALRILVNGLSI